MGDSTSHESESQLALASRGSQDPAGAQASSAAGSAAGQVAVGWDPFDVWLQRIERPRRGKGSSTRR